MKITVKMICGMLAAALLLVPLLGCSSPADTPPASPTPTATPAPAETPLPEYSTVEASLFGQTVSFDLGPSGQLWDPVSATSADGKLTLDIEAAAFAIDENQDPITSLSAALAADAPAGADSATHVIADAYSFGPTNATFSPPAVLVYSYDAAAVSALGLTEDDISLAYYDAASDQWQPVRAEIDTTAKTLTAKVGMFKGDYTLSIIAVEPAAEEEPEPEGLFVKLVYITEPIATNSIIEVVLKTKPGATVMLQPVNPKTSTRSAWPKEADGGKVKVADEKGEVSYAWELFRQTSRGEGTFEILATISANPDVLAQINANMSRRDIEKAAEDPDTIFVEIPFTVSISDY